MKKAITFAIALILSMCTSITAFAEGESVVYFDSGFDYHHRVSINFPFDAGITSSTEKSSVILFSSQPVQKIDGTAHFIVTHPNSDKPVPPSVENKSSISDRDKWITTFMIRATNANGLNIGETSAPETMTVTLTDGNTMDIACTLELTNIPSIFWRDADTGKMFKNVVGQVGKEQRIQAVIRDYEGRYNSFSIEWEHVTGDADIISVVGAPGSTTEGMRTDGIVSPVAGKEFVGSTITVIPRTVGERVHLRSRLYDPDGNGLFPYWDIGFRVEGSLQEFENLDDVKDAIQNGAPVAIPPNTGLSANNISELKAALESGTLSNSEVVLSNQQDDGCNLQMSFDLNDPAFDSSKVRIPFTPAYTAAMPEEAKGSGISQVGSQWLQFSYSGEPPAPMKITLDIDPNSTLGSASQIIIWRYNGVGEMQLVTSANVQKNADGKNIKATFVLDHFSTYALYQEGVNPNPATSTGGSSSGGSGGGSGSRLFADKNTQKQQPQSKTLSAQEAQKLAESALTEAKVGGTKQGIVRVLNISELSRDVLNTIANTAKTQNGKLMIHADTVANKVVTGRLYLDPANTALTAPIATGIQIGHASTESIFRKHFQNKIAAFELAQSGAFGANIEVAVKLDLTGWDISKIKLYSYHATSNTYMLLNNAAPFVDANGYLHITTGAGGVVVISEGLLKAL